MMRIVGVALLLLLGAMPSYASSDKEDVAVLVALVGTGELECGIRPDMEKYSAQLRRVGDDMLFVSVAAEQARQRALGRKVKAKVDMRDPAIDEAIGKLVKGLTDIQAENGKTAMCDQVRELMRTKYAVMP